MILITSAKYVNPELQVEFGKIPPSFLPLGAKRLYEHQVRLFQDSNERIVLSLPENYRVSIADEDKLDSLGVTIVRVKDGLSLGESIVFVLNMLLPIDESLSILHGDTLFTNIQRNKQSSSIEISKADKSYNWEYVIQNGSIFINNAITEYIIDELVDHVVSGYFNFHDAYAFIKALTLTGFKFIDAIKSYADQYPMQLVENDTWLDFGLSATYFHSKQSFTTERSFNSLKITDGYVTKCSEKRGKLDSEINWYEKMPEDLDLFLPRFKVVENGKCYQTEYLYLNTLSELYVFGNLPAHAWKQIFQSSKLFLKKLHQNKANLDEISFDYKIKTLQRINEFAKNYNIDLTKTWTYNNQPVISLYDMIKRLDIYLNKKMDGLTLIHGDFCMSNIMYDFKANRIKVFDPRGMDFDGKITPYGKSEYDYAKLMHSVFGLYDYIISGFYKLSYDEDRYSLNFEIDHKVLGLVSIQEAYKEIFGIDDFKHLFSVMIHLFLSMLPLHSDDKNRQFALLANAFRLFEELERME